METRHVDIAIIGAGSAGMGAYREARKLTDSIALIEGGDYGTTCARVGCMPSKLLIAAAEAAHGAHSAEVFGLNVSKVEIDGKAVMARVRSERDRFVGFVVEDINDFDPKHHVRGYASFKDAHTLLIDTHTQIIAKRIVIAVGSRPHIPAALYGAGESLLVNDDIFELEQLPHSVAVMGTGVIGLELGQALSRLGVRVSMFARSDSIGGIADSAIKAYAAKTFGEEFELHMNTQVLAATRVGQSVQIQYQSADGEVHHQIVEYVLAATGRVSNLDRLNIERAGLQFDTRGVPEYNRNSMQSTVPHIFIAGDANNELPLLHEASDEGRIAGRNAGLYPAVEESIRRAHLGVVFSDPQIASIGKRSHELEDSAFVVGEVSFESQGRSRVMAKNKGMLKVYAERDSGRLLGAEMFGPAAEHIGHLLSWAVQQELTVDEILAMPFYHPVIEEGVRTAFRNAKAQLSDLTGEQNAPARSA